MLLQAAVNGPYGKGDHPAMPVSAAELAQDAAACVVAGAEAIHMHPRDADGRESLHADVVDPIVRAVRDACGVPIGVSTGAWIEPDLDARLALVAAWRESDYASVNVSEDGSERVMAALTEAGIGIEAGVWSVEDAERLAASGFAGTLTRVLVEPLGAAGAGLIVGIHAALDRLRITAPRLQHGNGEAAWPLLGDAIARGIGTRIGLEDTLVDPDGHHTEGNAALVAAARRLGA